MHFKPTPDSPPLLLFDGLCNLCNGAVQAVIKGDPRGLIQFASLQSSSAQELFKKYSLSTTDLDSVVLISSNEVFVKSDAILEVSRILGGCYRLVYALKLIPKRRRDLLYDWVAKNRFSWFGKRTSCMIPTDELKHRFLA